MAMTHEKREAIASRVGYLLVLHGSQRIVAHSRNLHLVVVLESLVGLRVLVDEEIAYHEGRYHSHTSQYPEDGFLVLCDFLAGRPQVGIETLYCVLLFFFFVLIVCHFGVVCQMSGSRHDLHAVPSRKESGTSTRKINKKHRKTQIGL